MVSSTIRMAVFLLVGILEADAFVTPIPPCSLLSRRHASAASVKGLAPLRMSSGDAGSSSGAGSASTGKVASKRIVSVQDLARGFAMASMAAALLFEPMSAHSFVTPSLDGTPLAKKQTKIEVEGMARVVDGDTLVIEDGKGGKERIRLLGIDAPESKQTCKDGKGGEYMCGIESQQKLQQILGKDPVKCVAEKRDMYSRVLGVCFDERTGVELNKAMVDEGEAIAYTQYSKAYVVDEGTAKARKTGVWRGQFQEPWEYRKARREAAKQAKAEADAAKAGLSKNLDESDMLD